MPHDNEIDALQERIVALQMEVRELRQGPMGRFTGWRAALFHFMFSMVMFASVLSLMDRFGIIFGWSPSLDAHSIRFEGDGVRGNLSTIGPELAMDDEETKSSFLIRPDGIRLEDEKWTKTNFSIERGDIRSENERGEFWIEQAKYLVGDVEGLVIGTSSAKDPARHASLVLALPDGKTHLKPRLILLGADGKPVE